MLNAFFGNRNTFQYFLEGRCVPRRMRMLFPEIYLPSNGCSFFVSNNVQTIDKKEDDPMNLIYATCRTTCSGQLDIK